MKKTIAYGEIKNTTYFIMGDEQNKKVNKKKERQKAKKSIKKEIDENKLNYFFDGKKED